MCLHVQSNKLAPFPLLGPPFNRPANDALSGQFAPHTQTESVHTQTGGGGGQEMLSHHWCSAISGHTLIIISTFK